MGFRKPGCHGTEMRVGQQTAGALGLALNTALCGLNISLDLSFFFSFFFFFFFFFFFSGSSRATPEAYGDSQARGLIGAVDDGLCQSHSNAGSELCLQPTPQLMAMPDP